MTQKNRPRAVQPIAQKGVAVRVAALAHDLL
jgi:hypothetical protein